MATYSDVPIGTPRIRNKLRSKPMKVDVVPLGRINSGFVEMIEFHIHS